MQEVAGMTAPSNEGAIHRAVGVIVIWNDCGVRHMSFRSAESILLLRARIL